MASIEPERILTRKRLDVPAQSDPRERIFRQEALQRRFDIVQPQPLAIAPPSWRVTSLVLFIIAVCAIAFLIFGTFPRKEKVSGVLKPVAGEVVLGSDRAGVLVGLYVADNQMVARGAPLFDVRTETTLLDGRMLASESGELIDAQARIAQAEAEAQAAGLEAQIAALREKQEGSRALMERISSRRVLAAGRSRIADEEYERARILAERGFVTRQDLRRKEDAQLAARLDEEQILTEMAKAREAQAGYPAEARRLLAQSRLDRSRAHMVASEFDEQRLSSTQSRGYRVRSPISGRVSGLRATTGMWTEPGAPMLTIVPDAGPLVAELYVPSRAIGFIAPGQRARLLYDAFPFEKFGVGEGTVTTVSRSPLQATDRIQLAGSEEPHYLVRVRLDSQSISAFGKRQPLRPGMLLRADLILEQRSFLEWLFEPVLSSSGRLM